MAHLFKKLFPQQEQPPAGQPPSLPQYDEDYIIYCVEQEQTIDHDHNQKTHLLLRQLGLFPDDLITTFNEGIAIPELELNGFLGEKTHEIVARLDDYALQTIRRTIIDEYARCTQLSEKAVVKSFDGTPVAMPTATERDIQALNAIRAIIAESEVNGK